MVVRTCFCGGSPAPGASSTQPKRSRLAVVAVDVVEWFSGDQRRDPIHTLHPVSLGLVEPWPFEDPVTIAGCGVAVDDHPGVLDRRLVGVEHLEELRRVHTDRLRA